MDPEGQRLLQRLPDWLPDAAQPAVLVTVWAVQGSAPRQVGARMLTRDGRLLAGTIGGGHLEAQALLDALLVLGHACGGQDAQAPTTTAEDSQETAHAEGGLARLCRYPLGPQLAQCCGGVVHLHYQAVDAQRARQLSAQVQQAQREQQPFQTHFGDATLRERPQPQPTVLLFGAGHVAAALAKVLQTLPWRTVVIDARPEWADALRFPRTTEVLCAEPLRLCAAWGWLGAAAQQSQAAARLSAHLRQLPEVPRPEVTCAVVMTHDHALDRDICEALLHAGARSQGPALRYIGMIGSQSKVAALHQRLRRRGVDPALLDQLVAPIGLRIDGRLLGGSLPGEIAVSVAAQLLALESTGSHALEGGS